MRWLTIFLTGFLFAIGLGVSGMTQPEKVIGFLDVAGNWDPSLMFVMIGAIGINIILYRLTNRRAKPLFDARFTIPRRRDISPRLLIGSALFGIGWGLGGYCPGPAWVSTANATTDIFIFVGAMLIGMLLFRLLQADHQDDDVAPNQSVTESN